MVEGNVRGGEKNDNFPTNIGKGEPFVPSADDPSTVDSATGTYLDPASHYYSGKPYPSPCVQEQDAEMDC